MRLGRGALGLALALAATPLEGQGRPEETTVIDSIDVVGANRVPRTTVVALIDIPTGRPISFRDVQRAIQTLYATGQYEDVSVYQGTVNGREVLRFELVERPILAGFSIRGAEQVPVATLRSRLRLYEQQPYDPAAAARARATIDSIYQHRGFPLASVRMRELPQPNGTLRLLFEVDEGSRVAIAQVTVEGNSRFSDEQIVDAMKTGPEGFFWFQKGEYKEEELDRDLRERLPSFYGRRGLADFQVLKDTLIVYPGTGKAALHLTVEEGPVYRVGSFEIVGNRQFSTQLLEQYYPFADSVSGGFLGLGGSRGSPVFDQQKWEEATQNVRTLYYNNGYIYADVRPVVTRRTDPDGTHWVDLRWQIAEGSPAIVNKIIIKGNTITHEDVIRRAIVMVPGDVFRQEALIRSYQNISNLGYFEQPLPPPTYEPANEQGDVNVIFEVRERRTGNINFGASLGQGTGIGGFIGLEENNLFGKGKQIRLQWQFGRYINDFNVSYTDPALWGSLRSGTVSLHNSFLRYQVGNLGRIRTRGITLQLGQPLFGSRYTRLFTSYVLEQNQYDLTENLQPVFGCRNCVLSSLGLSLLRDTRIDLPFASSGVMHQFQVAQGGGPLGGSGNFQRATFEGRWYATLAQFGGSVTSSPLKLVVGLTSKAGAVFGDAGPHFRQLFTMGGTQFGVPLRGYEEFSITPSGFDPGARSSIARGPDAWGKAYFATTTELGLRISQAFYVNVFLDAGNVWASPRQMNPTKLFRGAGIGVNVISPLGPIGLDYAYGFDRTDEAGNPKPGWKFHFKLGNLF
ncbi:Outer membrane protein assembly factor BamA [bacterium HR33]|nr:Outer membrane protein assembly factor BamA [bacterium HR33]